MDESMMDEKYAKGLESSDPCTILDSAIWIVSHPNETSDQELYSKSCQILLTACKEDSDCVRYVDSNLTYDLFFKTQLFTQALSETNEAEVKQTLQTALCNLVDQLLQMQPADTHTISEIYSYLEQSGDEKIIEKAKTLL